MNIAHQPSSLPDQAGFERILTALVEDGADFASTGGRALLLRAVKDAIASGRREAEAALMKSGDGAA
ncbi:hypothetical protein DUP91_28750, partial [Salmonella enterica subsp. enterica]|nr:hypothetical protein [Salmonella enterica subsp. enterica]